ncbi:Uncharacterised protein [Mycobacteroides abscessus subsp. abscessus]|nr:Uncharacterised protein [Mycobacteroides abscessus subsp. abscessus]
MPNCAFSAPRSELTPASCAVTSGGIGRPFNAVCNVSIRVFNSAVDDDASPSVRPSESARVASSSADPDA